MPNESPRTSRSPLDVPSQKSSQHSALLTRCHDASRIRNSFEEWEQRQKRRGPATCGESSEDHTGPKLATSRETIEHCGGLRYHGRALFDGSLTDSTRGTARFRRNLTDSAPDTDQWFADIYDALRRLASRWIDREAPGHTLEPAALVNEAYLRLSNVDSDRWHDRGHFFAVAARALRRILVDHARSKGAAKRGGNWERISLSGVLNSAGSNEPADGDDPNLDLLALDRSLDRLSAEHPRPAQVVELRYFSGATLEETAAALSISTGTVKADWRFARAWLLSTLCSPESDSQAGHTKPRSND